MSWSVSSAGKAPAVAAHIEAQFKQMTYPCPEPEESAKQLVRQAIAKLLGGHTLEKCVVKISANGSQGWGGKHDAIYNSLAVNVEIIPIIE